MIHLSSRDAWWWAVNVEQELDSIERFLHSAHAGYDPAPLLREAQKLQTEHQLVLGFCDILAEMEAEGREAAFDAAPLDLDDLPF